jgi:hypothetical protein
VKIIGFLFCKKEKEAHCFSGSKDLYLFHILIVGFKWEIPLSVHAVINSSDNVFQNMFFNSFFFFFFRDAI